jgi:hypothetical protein
MEGNVTYDELFKHLIEHRRALGLSHPEIVDARTFIPAVTSAEVRSLVGLLRALAQGCQIGPTAFVVADKVAYAIARMVGMLADDVTQVAPFWSEEDAEHWIFYRGAESS